MNVRDLFKRRPASRTHGELFASAEAEHSGLFAGYFLKPEESALLALPEMVEGAVLPVDMHVTICYGGDVAEAADVAVMKAIVTGIEFSTYEFPIKARVSGVGRFQAAGSAEGGLDAIVALVDAPGLSSLHELIRSAFSSLQFEQTHGYTPHIALAYVAPGSALPVQMLAEVEFDIDSVTIAAGKFVTTVKLGQGLAPAVFGETDGGTERMFLPARFSEAPEWIPYLPIPGQYKHPRLGNLDCSAERLGRFVENFNAHVYQERVPLDAEHETKVSGAVGWLTELRQNENGSVDAKVEWTERGRQLLAEDRFRYVSAEWYDTWTSPLGEVFTDVIIGGAITTRPFFKESVLRPLAASEPTPTEGSMTDQKDATQATEPVALAELQTQLAEEKAARLAEVDKSAKLTEEVRTMQAQGRRARFTEEVRGKSDANNILWFGETSAHVAHLEKLAVAFGEDSAEVKHYIDTNRASAQRVMASDAFKSKGSDARPEASTAMGEIEALAAKLREADPKLTKEAAFASVVASEPELYVRYRQEG